MLVFIQPTTVDNEPFFIPDTMRFLIIKTFSPASRRLEPCLKIL